MAPMKQSQLAPSTVVKTNLPFPVVDVEASKIAGKVIIAPHATEKLVVESASELVERSVQTSIFRTKGGQDSPLDIVHDAKGQPMVFSIGSDGHLYCVLHADKVSHPWQLLDVTPPIAQATSSVVSSFDVLESRQNLHIAISLKHKVDDSDEEIHQVYWTTLKLPTVEVDDEGSLKGFSASDLNWTPVGNNLGSRVVTKLMCSPSPNAAQPGFIIFTATQTTATYLASTYAIDPSPSAEAPWTVINFGAQSNKIVDMQPLVLGGASGQSKRRSGLALLHDAPAPGYEAGSILRCNAVTLNDARNEAFSQYSLNTSKVGRLSGIYTSLNSWGTHDVLIAGNGIAFHQFQNLNDPCLDKDGQIILPDIAFRQVFCKETMLSNPRRYMLSILAVSQDNELYVIDGERDPKNFGLPTFRYSGLPIRGDVAQIACHFNKELSSMEFIYTTQRDNQICHLARDPTTSVWTSTDLQIKGPATITKERQYSTTITISDSEGNPVPEGYTVALKSEPVFVTVNDLSYRLNRSRSTIVTTDSMGQIEITTAAPHQFGVSDIEVALSEYSEKPFTFSINMASRVMSVMASIKSKDDLKSLRTESGKPMFDHIADEKLEASAALLSNFDELKKATKDDSADEHAADASWANSSVTLADWNGDQSGVDATHSSEKKSWFGKALEVAVEYIGDAIEFLRKAVKFTVKWAIKIAGPIVKFIVRVGSKVLSIIVKTAVTLVRSVVGVLDNLLGTDMMGWLGLHFGKHIPNIQNRLKEVTLGSLDVLNRFLITNRESLLQFFEDAEDVLFDDLQNAQEQDVPREESSVMRFVRSVLNSPIMKLIFKFNPISWIMEGVSEGMEEAFPDWKLPNFGPLADAIGLSAKGILEIGLGAFMELFSVISMSATDVLTKPRELIPILIRAARKMFKGAFDATRDLALLAFDTLIRVVMTIPAILTQVWKIPGLTDLWEDWIGQEFSLINFATYGIAVFVDLVTVTFTEAQKDRVFGQPFGEQWTQFDIEPMYRGARRAADQAALEAKYPGPSLPEHTNPMVMMVAFSDAGKGEDNSRRKEEEKKTLQTGQIIEEILNILTSAFKMLTLFIEVKEGYAIVKANRAAQKDMKASGPLLEAHGNPPVAQGLGSKVWGGCKLFSAHSLWASLSGKMDKLSGMLPLKLSSKVPILRQDHPMSNTLATSFAFLGCGIGALVDVLGSSVTASSGSTAEQTQRAAGQQKWFLGVGGTMFNVSCAAMSWQVGENCQAIGNLAGAGAVMATHGLSNSPAGLKITVVCLVADGGFTGYSIFCSARKLGVIGS